MKILLPLAALSLLSSLGFSQTHEVALLPGGEQRLTVETAGGQAVLRTSMGIISGVRSVGAADQDAQFLRWLEVAADGSSTEWYAASPDGQAWDIVRPISHELLLRYGAHDPLEGEPAVSARLTARPTSNLHLVQLEVPPSPSLQERLIEAGAEVHRVVPRHALLLTASPRSLRIIASLPFVRAVREYHPAFKVERELLPLAENVSPQTAVTVNLLTLRRGLPGQSRVTALVEALGGRVVDASRETYLMTVTLPTDALADLVGSDDVAWIDRWSAPEEDVNTAREFHGANFVESTLGLTGSSLRVEVLDGGCDLTHPDLANHVVHGSMVVGNHGTACSGIVAGSGAGNASARGVLPEALLIAAYYNGLSGSRYNHTRELDDPTGTLRSILQTNSWGNSRTTAYTSISQDLDQILFDFEKFSILQSQSNAGNQDSRPQAWAKNVISVGGVRHYNTLSESDDAWNAGASIGPAVDGRIKPDLSSFYDSTLTTDVVGSGGYASGNYYSSFGGTSGATPIVAGHLGMLMEMWGNGAFGNSAPAVDPFDDRPHNTTAKALLINTARQWDFSGTNADLTRVHQGWGRPDLAGAYSLRDKTFVVDESDVLAPLGSTVHTLNVEAGEPAFKATMVFRDPPGTTSSTVHRINNLDLKVTSPSGTVYWGNNGLLGSMWSSAGGFANSVDTVENVYVQNPEAGSWSVEVIATEVLADTHVETGATDADYALVVTGATTGPPPAPVAGFVATPLAGFAPLDVTFTDQSSGSVDTRAWDFGDGGSAAVTVPVHTYTAPGTYTVSLSVTGPGGSDALSRTNYITVQVLTVPDAPSGLTAGTPTANAIGLAWSDNSSSEDSFEVERSLDGVDWTVALSAPANATSATDTGLAPGTTYWYRVFARNGAGDSASSNVAQATTTFGSTEIVVAGVDVPVVGTVTGTVSATRTGNLAYQSLRERESGGKPANRTSRGEHRWQFTLPAGSGLSFHANAYRTASSDGDVWRAEVSQDQQSWQTMFSVTKTGPSEVYQSATLPAAMVGTVYVRVIDSDRASGNRSLDTIFVDHLYFEVTGVGAGLPPGSPSGLVAAPTSSSEIGLSWTDGSSSEDGFELQRSPDGASWSTIASSLAANSTSFTDGGLQPDTEYRYRTRAFNSAGSSAWSNVATATTFAVGTADVVPFGEQAGAGAISGSYVDVQSANGSVQSLTERESGGKPANRYSYGSHVWLINAPAGQVSLFVMASMVDAGDGESFLFEVSTNGGSSWTTTPVVIAPSTSAAGYQSGIAVPSHGGGEIRVRVRDSDQTSGQRGRERVEVDHLFLRVQ